MKQLSAFLTVALALISASHSTLGASLSVRENSNPQQPASPQGVTVDISLDASVLATTLGVSGVSQASQQVEEHVLGDIHTPAQLNSSSGVQTGLLQQGAIEDVAIVASEDSSLFTLNEAQAGHTVVADAGDLEAQLLGGLGAEVAHSGASYGFGGGFILVGGNTAVLEENN